ncbi:TPA: minor capsid protein [Streptococcus suis]|nr:minor capsid protein [Streptococcus suis]
MVTDYWKKRIEAEQLAKMERGATLGEEMDRLYSYHFNELEKEIRAFEQRYADKNGLSLAEVKARVDDFDVKSFEEKAKRYVAEKNFSARANSELALYNLKMKTNRLALLQYNLDLELIALAEDERQLTERFLNNEFIKAIETQSGLLGRSVLSASQIGTTAQAILNTPFHGANWSDNIWKRQTALREVVARMTERLLLQGKNPTTMVAQLRKEFNVTASEAKRLAVTEGARVATEGQKQAYIANGYDEYEFIAEPSACRNCAKLDGKIFKVKDMEPGENAAPMHPWCHCSTGAHVGDSIPKLGQARKSGDKVFITNQSIEKVPLINIPGYSAVENSNIQLAHKQLLAETRDKNNSDELMYILLGEKPIKVFGDQFGVEINSHSDARFILNSSKQRTLTVLHNHPGGSTFSLNDFNFFMGTPSVRTLTIVSNTGRVMYVTKTNSFDFVGAVKTMKEINKKIDSDIERVFKKMYNHGIRYKLK